MHKGTNPVTATAALGGEPDNIAINSPRGEVLVPVVDTDRVVVLDPTSLAIVARPLLPTGTDPYGHGP